MRLHDHVVRSTSISTMHTSRASSLNNTSQYNSQQLQPESMTYLLSRPPRKSSIQLHHSTADLVTHRDLPPLSVVCSSHRVCGRATSAMRVGVTVCSMCAMSSVWSMSGCTASCGGSSLGLAGQRVVRLLGRCGGGLLAGKARKQRRLGCCLAGSSHFEILA